MTGKMNWDRVRKEKQIQEQGSEKVRTDYAIININKPQTPLGKMRAIPRRTSAKHVAHFQKEEILETKICEICQVAVRVDRVAKHMRKVHPQFLKRPPQPSSSASSVRTKKLKILVRKPNFVHVNQTMELETLCSALMPQCSKINPHRLIKKLARNFDPSLPLRGRKISNLAAEKVRSFIQDCCKP